MYLNDMVLEINIRRRHVVVVLLLGLIMEPTAIGMGSEFTRLHPRPVLEVECADEICRPATHETIEDLQQNPRWHSELSKGIGQGQQHLRDLMYIMYIDRLGQLRTISIQANKIKQNRQ